MFAEKLKELRNTRGLTQQDLANAIGVSRSAIGNYENGDREPNFEVAETMADFFNVPLGTLIGQQQIDDYFNELRREQLKKALFGDSNVPDVMLDEVLEYAKFVKNRKF